MRAKESLALKNVNLEMSAGVDLPTSTLQVLLLEVW